MARNSTYPLFSMERLAGDIGLPTFGLMQAFK
jgi:hypothetical protein